MSAHMQLGGRRAAVLATSGVEQVELIRPLPGGVANPDKLRVMPEAVAFVRHLTYGGKPIAAIRHGPWTLLEIGFVRGKPMTSWPSLRTDLTNAGAHWVDEESVTDGDLVTARKPDDIPAFDRAMIQAFAGSQQRRAA